MPRPSSACRLSSAASVSESALAVTAASLRKGGRIGWRAVGRKAQRRAISLVFSIASGRSANSSRICSARLEVMLGAQTAPVVDRDIAPFGDADQRVMRFEIVARREIRLVSGDDGQVEIVGKLEQLRLDGALLRQAMALQLDIEPVAEKIVQSFKPRAGKLGIAVGERAVDDALGASGQRDQSCGMHGKFRASAVTTSPDSEAAK